MQRRTFVSTVCLSLVSLAGCANTRSPNRDPGGSGGYPSGDAAVADRPNAYLNMTAIDESALPPKVLYSLGEDDGPDSRVRLMERIVDSPTTVEGTRPPLPENEHIFYDGVIYQLSHEVVEQTPATTYSVKIDIVQDSVEADEAIQFADLPEVDREIFDRRGFASGEVVGIGTTLRYTDSEAEQSVLVPESEYSYIVWENGSEAEWVVDDSSETPLNTYDYTAERIAAAAEYGEQMRDRFAFELSNLSDAQQDIVESARNEDEYRIGSDESPPSEFVDLVERFQGQEQPRGLNESEHNRSGGNYLNEYDDTVYWTTVYLDAQESETKRVST